MVGGIDFGGAQQRHHDRLHQEFKHGAENDADSEAANPAPWSHVADVAPWRMRSPGPQKHQRPPSGLTTDVKTMTRIERTPSGPNPRSCWATGSSGGGAARASSGSAGTCSGKFGTSLCTSASTTLAVQSFYHKRLMIASAPR